MSIAKIQTGDNVKIIAGNHKGLTGVVTKVVKSNMKNGSTRIRASVNSVPKIAKYRASQSFQGQTYPGAKFEVDRLVDISNLSLLTPANETSKVKIEIKGDKKVRIYKKGGLQVAKVEIKKDEKADKADMSEEKTEVTKSKKKE
jgi:large subunit ribosomal protein L24